MLADVAAVAVYRCSHMLVNHGIVIFSQLRVSIFSEQCCLITDPLQVCNKVQLDTYVQSC